MGVPLGVGRCSEPHRMAEDMEMHGVAAGGEGLDVALARSWGGEVEGGAAGRWGVDSVHGRRCHWMVTWMCRKVVLAVGPEHLGEQWCVRPRGGRGQGQVGTGNSRASCPQ